MKCQRLETKPTCDEEESPDIQAVALTLEGLPTELWIWIFLSIEHGSQFSALRQTSKQFKEVADAATRMRRQNAETVNTDGTYVYRGHLYGTQTKNETIFYKGERPITRYNTCRRVRTLIHIWFAGEEHGVQKAWHENKQDYEENWKDGKRDGVLRGWHANRQLSHEDNYKDGERDGVQKGWHENGNPEYDKKYKDGKYDGVQKRWHENGQIGVEEYWKKGMKDGAQNLWWSNGQQWEEGNWKDGKEDGVQKVWNWSGQLQSEDTYKDGVKQEGFCSLI